MASQRPSAEHDGRLTDPKLRETSFERAFAYDRLRSCFVEGWTAGEVVRFHSSEKLLLLSRDPQSYADLGRLVAAVKDYKCEEFAESYQRIFRAALAKKASAGRQVNVEVQGIVAAPLILQESNVVSSANGTPAVGQGVMVAIRPEQVAILGTTADGRSNTIQANLQAVQFLGDRYEYTVEIGAETRVLVSPASQQVKPGDKICLELKPEGMTLWPRE